MGRGCNFNELWLQQPKYKDWLSPANGDKYSARCHVCASNVNLKSRAWGKQPLPVTLRVQDRLAKSLKDMSTKMDIGRFFSRQTGKATGASCVDLAEDHQNSNKTAKKIEYRYSGR